MASSKLVLPEAFGPLISVNWGSKLNVGLMQAAEIRYLHPPQRHATQSLMGMTT